MSKLAFLFLFVSLNAFPCGRSVDANKVIVFVNTNNSYKEMIDAREAACLRGESFLQIPNLNEDTSLLLDQLNEEKANLRARCLNRRGAWICQNQQRSRMSAITQEMLQLSTGRPKVDSNVLNQQIQRLASQNKAITTAIFSGHDGGGRVYGEATSDTGEIDKTDFIESFNRHYRARPNLKTQLESVYMWGCYTTTPEEVITWKEQLPHLKIIAGYIGSAPSNQNVASRRILRDMLLSEGRLIGATSESALRSQLAQIDNLSSTHSAIYVDHECANCESFDGTYFSRTQAGAQYMDFGASLACNSESDQAIRTEYLQYYSGRRAHNATRLREIYNYTREKGHCFDQDSLLDPNRVANLLFWPDVKHNFPRVFRSEINEALEAYRDVLSYTRNKTLPPQRFIGNDYTGRVQVWGPSDEEKASLRSFKAQIERFNRNFRFPNSRNLGRHNRRQILNHISELRVLLNHRYFKGDREIRPERTKMLRLHNAMVRYLHAMKPSCMSFHDWHERAGSPPRRLCSLN